MSNARWFTRVLIPPRQDQRRDTAAVRAHGADNNPAVLAVLIEIARNLAIMADAASPIRKIRG
jgi:hypothetical protein